MRMAEKFEVNETCSCDITSDDWDLIICRCEEVSRGEIIQAINEGARTVEDVKRRTRAGMGLCQSKTCLRNLQRIIAEITGQDIKDVLPFTGRSPVRPVPLEVLATLVEEEKHE
jgi:NAD(P)H-nitrite reductase large subunit